MVRHSVPLCSGTRGLSAVLILIGSLFKSIKGSAFGLVGPGKKIIYLSDSTGTDRNNTIYRISEHSTKLQNTLPNLRTLYQIPEHSINMCVFELCVERCLCKDRKCKLKVTELGENENTYRGHIVKVIACFRKGPTCMGMFTNTSPDRPS